MAKPWSKPIRGFPVCFDPWANPGDCTFDRKVAQRVVRYWEDTFTLKDGKFEGKPFTLQPWQKQIVGHLFGWKRPDGSRRFRTLFLYVPKKNGKTQFGAGLGLVLLMADGEPGAQVYSCASDTEQAKIVFDAAAKMVEHNRGLTQKVRVYKGYKALEYTHCKSYWKVLSGRADSKHGPNVHGLLIDELHTQRNDELVETLEAGTVAREQPLVIKMTTAGHIGDTPCNRELEYARGVLSGDIDDPYYMPVVFDGQKADKDDPSVWQTPAFWRQVNPSFGVTIQGDFYDREVKKCSVAPSHVNAFKRLHLNIQTDSVSSWLDADAWQDCAKDAPAEGPCFGAIDLASTTDISALALYWPASHRLDVRMWVPQECVQRRAEYLLWHQAGWLQSTPGATTDYSFIRSEIAGLCGVHEVQQVAYDPWNATHLVTELADEDGMEMVEFRQGYISMNMPSKEFERLVIARELRHTNNPVLNWMAQNVAVKTDPSGNIRPVKPERNSTKKVDGIVAAVMAVGLSMNADTDAVPGECVIVI